MQGGTAATQDVFIENVGFPTLAAISPRRSAPSRARPPPQSAARYLGRHPQWCGRRQGLALGADAVSIGTAALIALGDNDPALEAEYAHLARRPAPTTTGTRDSTPPASRRRIQKLGARLDPVLVVAGSPTTSRSDPRGADHRARVRKVASPQSRARGPCRADDRGCRDGGGAARGNRLDTGQNG